MGPIKRVITKSLIKWITDFVLSFFEKRGWVYPTEVKTIKDEVMRAALAGFELDTGIPVTGRERFLVRTPKLGHVQTVSHGSETLPGKAIGRRRRLRPRSKRA